MQDIKIMLSELADKVEGLVNEQDIKFKLAELSDMIERSIETKEALDAYDRSNK
jgi:murein tripeptide amidase MpaA